MTEGTSVPLVLAGRYRLDRPIGRGGMGVVWLGHDELLGRAVALKRIGAERSQREAQLAARLQHPHVVAVYDLVEDPVEGAFLVMEYVKGTTLSGLVLERGALRPDEALPLLEQIADGLAAATLAGVTHRDVKPSNVLVQPDGIAKLSDFGIARAAADATQTQTQTGMLMGSPAYVAPEVASGARADHAADVWSFGATAYFVLAGVPPYETDNPLSTLYRIVHEDPPDPPVAGRAATLISHTMTKDPGHRWSIGEVHSFLRDATLPAARPIPAPSLARPIGEPVAPTTRLRATEVRPHRHHGPHRPHRPHRRPSPLALAAVLLPVILLAALGVGLHAALSGGSPTPSAHASTKKSSTGASVTKPTAAGMEAFIRSYVRTVSDDPDQAWGMLTPRFQAESGGLDHYRSFWSAATNGRVLSITADPADLTVRYQVHFDDFHNGPGPTILELVHEHGRYLIDGETTKGFVPSVAGAGPGHGHGHGKAKGRPGH